MGRRKGEGRRKKGRIYHVFRTVLTGHIEAMKCQLKTKNKTKDVILKELNLLLCLQGAGGYRVQRDKRKDNPLSNRIQTED